MDAQMLLLLLTAIATTTTAAVAVAAARVLVFNLINSITKFRRGPRLMLLLPFELTERANYILDSLSSWGCGNHPKALRVSLMYF